MYTFFTVFGVLFVIVSSILINYIYSIFSINKLTNFLNPVDGRTVWNEVNITVLPILVWSFIEIPVLGDNYNFLLSVILNILVNCSIIYIIKYGSSILFKKENNLINIIAICSATTIGYLVGFMVLKSKSLVNLNNLGYIISISGMIILLALHAYIILRKPKVKMLGDEFEEKR